MKRVLGLAVATALLAGCAGLGAPGGVTPAAVAQYQAIANGLLSIAGSEAEIAGALPADVARIQADAELARVAIAALTPGLSASAAAPSVQTVETAVNDVLAIASALPLPAPVQQIVLALKVLLPVAEAAIAPSLAPAAAAGAGAMTPQRAMLVLQSAPHP